MLRPLLIAALLLVPAAAHAGPRLELNPTVRAFIDLAMVESTHPQLTWRAAPREPTPPPILGGPIPAGPAADPGARALGAFQYAVALLLGLGVQGNRYQDRSVGELPGLVRNGVARGGYPIWSDKKLTAP